MIHRSHLFDFPGRRFAFRHPSIARADELALRALADAVEPTVVELVDDVGATFHLVAGQEPGGAYVREPSRTRSVARIDGDALAAWYREHDAVRVWIADGWYALDAQLRDEVRLREGVALVIEHHGRCAVRAPSPTVTAPPFLATLRADEGALELAVQWSAWTDADGVGRGRFERLLAALASAGWELFLAPAPEDLGGSRAPATAPTSAPIAPAPAPIALVPAITTLTFTAVPAARVVLGLDGAEVDTLVERLLAIDRDAFDDEPTLGYRECDASKRRTELRTALAPSIGHAEVDVAAFEIQPRRVTNAMWRAYLEATSGTWLAREARASDDPVVGVSPDEATAFAAHYGWALPSEAEWQHAAHVGALTDLGASEYTRDAFTAYPRGQGCDPAMRCVRGSAPGAAFCIEGRYGIATNHRFRFATFRCIRR